jgi:hypothetical protein
VAASGDPTTFARIGIMRALHHGKPPPVVERGAKSPRIQSDPLMGGTQTFLCFVALRLAEELSRVAELSRRETGHRAIGRAYECFSDPDEGRHTERSDLLRRPGSQPRSFGFNRNSSRSYRGLGVFSLSRGMVVVRLGDRLIDLVWSCVFDGATLH